MSKLTSLQNPRVKEVVRLRERRTRDKTGQYLIEGYRELLRASEGNAVVDVLFICPDLFLGENEPTLIDALRRKGAQVLECTEYVFRKMSYRDRPDGMLGVARQLGHSLDELPVSDNPFLLVAEAIEKPGNLGTILRSCDAAGVDGLVVCDRCTDIHNPNVVRASIGTLFTVPVAEAGGEETLQWLRQHKVQILAATPEADKEFTEVDLTGPVAVVVGTEQLGLSERWMSEADIQVRIPMMGHADSLNVATATTLLLYEVLRQRRQHQHSDAK